MTEVQTSSSAAPPRLLLRGLRRGVYWGGRLLQGLGLLLLWWVLLLFAHVASMGALLIWVGIAAAVFYAGWVCTVWARKGRSLRA